MTPALFVRVAAALALAVLAQTARADLMLFPTRIVFDKQRAAQVELMNQGTTPETYRISLVNRRMGPNGEFTPITEPGPGEQFADAMLRFSPHQVTIPPGGSQIVRILLRKPAELAGGEYRSHLQFERVAEASGASSLEDAARRNAAGGLSVTINALVGASIPVIVRQGATQGRVSLGELQLLPPSPAAPGGSVSLQMLREGNASVYGDLEVSITTRDGVTVPLAKAGGVAVYVPNAARHAVLPLQLPEGRPLPAGTLKVSYRERPEAGARLLAEASLALP
ncbi:molecular chaperone [Pelomonas sp. KK5]|uniref:molecular chaperone n=1 Tax=Pelomonas sp. KK5 TaxID=1855730 RepID=UPI001E42B8C4|nr:molecular chaperone [Pelomonas sp. KK5]